jgi:hypothetical protein
MKDRICLFAAAFCIAAPTASPAQDLPPAAASSPAAPAPSPSMLVAGTPVMVVLNDNLTTKTSHVGDRFEVTVVDDVGDQGIVVIPKGTIGYGEVTFSTDKGGFGKGGILSISLRYLDLNGKQVILDGRYRQEGKSNSTGAAVTLFAIGIIAAAVKGEGAVIPKGRELKARTGEDIALVAAPSHDPAADPPLQYTPN